MGISFKGPGTFDFWIDEVAFIRTGGGTGTGGTTGAAGRGGTTGSAGTAGRRAAAARRVMPAPGQRGHDRLRRHLQRADAPADHRRHERLGVALLGLLQARLRLDRQHGRQDADQELQQGKPAALGLRRQELLRERRLGVHVLERRPWQVGPNLSYGVVAASGSNYSCGAAISCSSPAAATTGQQNSLNGKMMIVQVINNGGVAGDQFDLLIPGGGVGAAERLREPVGRVKQRSRRAVRRLSGRLQRQHQLRSAEVPDDLREQAGPARGLQLVPRLVRRGGQPEHDGERDRLPADDQGARAAVGAVSENAPAPEAGGARGALEVSVRGRVLEAGRDVQKRTAEVTARAPPAT